MTELIVALDGPESLPLMRELEELAGITWFKIGPAAIVDDNWLPMIRRARRANIFLDLKLADTSDTVYAAIQQYTEAGIAAVSITDGPAGNAATYEALRVAEGTPLQIWRVAWLTSAPPKRFPRQPLGHGIICPVAAAGRLKERYRLPTVCPGIRMPGEDAGCHGNAAMTPEEARWNDVDFAVVGRSIWQSANPVAAAKLFMMTLLKSGCS